MREKLSDVVTRVSRIVDAHSATRLMLKTNSDIVKSRFMDLFFKIIEGKEVPYDVAWLNRKGESIGVDNARAIKDFLAYHPSLARHKYVVADEIASATPEAISTLLKITEEPPAFAIFLFFTSNPSNVISTIKSRFTLFPLNVDPMSLVSNDVPEKPNSELVNTLMNSSPCAAVYISEHPKKVEKLLNELKSTESIVETIANEISNEELPDFIFSLMAERLLLSIEKREITMAFQKLRSIMNPDNSSKILKMFLDAALLIAEDILVLRNSAYWKGIKRKSYIPMYIEMKVPKQELFDWILKMYKTRADVGVSIFLLISEFVLLKGK